LRSYRSAYAYLVESYRRRRYKNYFISKLNGAETENSETQVWIDFSFDCNYISKEEYDKLTALNDEIGKLIWFMIKNPEKFM
jgi:four helix bundle protein